MAKRALIVVDLQNEYLSSGKLPLAGIDEALENAGRVIASTRADEGLVIHIRHEAPGESSPVFKPGTTGVEIIPTVGPRDAEEVIVKYYPNAFRETGLKAVLDAAAIDEVVVIGAMSHMCVAATSRAASDFGYRTIVIHDACATRDLEFQGETVSASQVHAANMAAIAFGHGTVMSTDELLAR